MTTWMKTWGSWMFSEGETRLEKICCETTSRFPVVQPALLACFLIHHGWFIIDCGRLSIIDCVKQMTASKSTRRPFMSSMHSDIIEDIFSRCSESCSCVRLLTFSVYRLGFHSNIVILLCKFLSVTQRECHIELSSVFFTSMTWCSLRFLLSSRLSIPSEVNE